MAWGEDFVSHLGHLLWAKQAQSLPGRLRPELHSWSVTCQLPAIKGLPVLAKLAKKKRSREERVFFIIRKLWMPV